MPWGNFFKFWPNGHLDLTMNWLVFHGQRSKAKIMVASVIIQTFFCLIITEFHIIVRLKMKLTLSVSQKVKGLIHSDIMISSWTILTTITQENKGIYFTFSPWACIGSVLTAWIFCSGLKMHVKHPRLWILNVDWIQHEYKLKANTMSHSSKL